MILVGQYDSFPTRRVGMVLNHYGMPFVRDTRSVFGDAEAIGRINPLVRIPALVMDDGEVLIETAAILDHLDEIAGARALVPRSGPGRRRILQQAALAAGIGEKAAAVAYERHFHPPGARSAEWESRCLSQVAAGLAALEAGLGAPWAMGAELTHGDFAIMCTLGYLRLRLPEALPAGRHPRLEALETALAALPAVQGAAIGPDEAMPS
jgi:glutathione S-transferase